MLKWLNKQFVKYNVGNKRQQINQLKIKGINLQLGDVGGIENIGNIMLDGELSKIGLLKMGASIFDRGAVLEFDISQENADGIKAIISCNLFNFKTILQKEGLLETMESLLEPQKQDPKKAVTTNINIKENQDQSDLAKLLPIEVRHIIFGFLDKKSLANVNNTCTLFYNDTKSILNSRHKQMLNEWLANIDENLNAVEKDLRNIDGEISYGKLIGGYMFKASGGNRDEITGIESKIRMALPMMRNSLLSLFYNVKLLERRDIHMDESFSNKLKDVYKRHHKTFGDISEMDLVKLDHEVDGKIQKESQQYTKRMQSL